MRGKLVLEGVGKQFSGFWAVKGVNAVVLPGKITAFVGPNGAGKTTLFHLITGELKPDEGRIFLDGKEITGLEPWKIARMGVGKQFQDVRIFENLTALENVIVALIDEREQNPLWVLANLTKIKDKFRKYQEKAMKYLEEMGLLGKENQLAKNLSFGQQKLLSFARLMAGDFDLLLMDEPTAGVAPAMIEKIIEIIKGLVEKEGKTVAIIEHNMSVVSRLAHWVYFMHEGRIAFTGRTDHVLGHGQVREIYMGL